MFKRMMASIFMCFTLFCSVSLATQQDFDITTGDANTGVTFRAAINAALQALASSSGGATSPALTYPNQLWADTANNKLYLRNTANTAWKVLGDLNADYLNLLTLGTAQSVTAQHTFAPASTQAPFVLGANAQGQKVTYLNSDLLDGFDESAFAKLADSEIFSRGSSGGTPHAQASLTIEDDVTHYLQLLGPITGNVGILFGDSGNAAQGMMYFSHTDNSLNFRTDQDIESFQISALGKLTNTVYIDGYSVAPGIHGRKASGTAAAPTNTKLYDDLVLMTSVGYTGSAWTTASGYAGLYATENWSGTANGTAFVVGLTTNGTAAPLPFAPERFLIYGDGRTMINQGAAGPGITASAALEIKSTTGALLLPRLDVTQRNALTATDGMMIYLTGYGLHARTLGSWQNVVTGGGPDIYSTGTGFVGIGGASVTSAKLAINGTDGALLLPRMDVTQRNALTPTNGMMIHLTGYGLHGYSNGAWANIVTGSGPDIWATGTGFVGIGGASVTSAKLAVNGTDGALLLSRLTSTQRDALTASNGMVLYNTTSTSLQSRVNGAWANIVTGGGPDIYSTGTGFVGIGASPSTGAKLDIGGTDGALRVSRLTQAQRNSLSGDGMIAYITDVPALQARVNGSWGNLVHDPSGLITIASSKLGIGGTPATSAKIDIQGTDGALLLSRLTTTERNALTAANGMMIYNSTLDRFQKYEGGAWANMANKQMWSITAESNYNSGDSYFNPINGGALSTVEAKVAIKLPSGGTLTSMAVYVNSNASNGDFTIVAYKNGATTGTTLTVSAAATGWQTWTGTVSYAAGDTISLKATNTGVGTVVIETIVSQFEVTG